MPSHASWIRERPFDDAAAVVMGATAFRRVRSDGFRVSIGPVADRATGSMRLYSQSQPTTFLRVLRVNRFLHRSRSSPNDRTQTPPTTVGLNHPLLGCPPQAPVGATCRGEILRFALEYSGPRETLLFTDLSPTNVEQKERSGRPEGASEPTSTTTRAGECRMSGDSSERLGDLRFC